MGDGEDYRRRRCLGLPLMGFLVCLTAPESGRYHLSCLPCFIWLPWSRLHVAGDGTHVRLAMAWVSWMRGDIAN